jgi:hypothetical protein
MGIHLAGEHAAELEPLDLRRNALNQACKVGEGAGVLLFARQLEQLGRFVERLIDVANRGDDRLELGALAA